MHFISHYIFTNKKYFAVLRRNHLKPTTENNMLDKIWIQKIIYAYAYLLYIYVKNNDLEMDQRNSA